MRVTSQSFVIGIIALLSTGCAGRTQPVYFQPDDRWVAILPGPGATIYLDAVSWQRLGPNEVRVWLLTRFRERQVMLGTRYFGEQEFIDFNCANRTSRIHQSTLQDANGRVVFHSQFPDPTMAQYNAVPPGSVTEVKYTATCRYLQGR